MRASQSLTELSLPPDTIHSPVSEESHARTGPSWPSSSNTTSLVTGFHSRRVPSAEDWNPCSDSTPCGGSFGVITSARDARIGQLGLKLIF